MFVWCRDRRYRRRRKSNPTDLDLQEVTAVEALTAEETPVDVAVLQETKAREL